MLDFLIRSLYNLSMLKAVKIGILRKSQYNDEGFLVKMYLEWKDPFTRVISCNTSFKKRNRFAENARSLLKSINI